MFAYDVGGHAQYRTGFHLVQIHGLIALYLHIIGGGVFQRGLDVVHREHRRTTQHTGLVVFFKRLDAGKEEIASVGIDGGKRHAGVVH